MPHLMRLSSLKWLWRCSSAHHIYKTKTAKNYFKNIARQTLQPIQEQKFIMKIHPLKYIYYNHQITQVCNDLQPE